MPKHTAPFGSGYARLGLRISFGFRAHPEGLCAGWIRVDGGRSPEIESRRARPEAAQDPLALNQQIGFQFGITAQDGCGTGLARER